MPEHEFELYLSLLSRFLRLKLAQHAEIADELRDHLEARLEELTERGLARDEAIRQALDEFGDAAELANHFTQLTQIRRRRLIMRFTFGTVAALAASLLVATAFWPESQQIPAPQHALAQFGGGGQAPTTGGAAIHADINVDLAIDAKLNKRIDKVEFAEMPLADVMSFLSGLLEVDILFDKAALSETELATDTPVTLHFVHSKPAARVVLDLVLEPLGLSYTTRDGLILVTTPGHANQIQVYNVRDLLGSDAESAATAITGGRPMGGMAGMGGLGGMAMGGGAAQADANGTTMGMIGGGSFGFVVRHTNSLADLIAMTIEPFTWEGTDTGAQGSIVQYRDLLIVKNSPTVHSKVRKFLDMLRTSVTGGPPTADREESKPSGTVRAPAKATGQ